MSGLNRRAASLASQAKVSAVTALVRAAAMWGCTPLKQPVRMGASRRGSVRSVRFLRNQIFSYVPRPVRLIRPSSDLQREASIADQFRVCRERAERSRWTAAGFYRDAAIFGGSMILGQACRLCSKMPGGAPYRVPSTSPLMSRRGDRSVVVRARASRVHGEEVQCVHGFNAKRGGRW